MAGEGPRDGQSDRFESLGILCNIRISPRSKTVRAPGGANHAWAGAGAHPATRGAAEGGGVA